MQSLTFFSALLLAATGGTASELASLLAGLFFVNGPYEDPSVTTPFDVASKKLDESFIPAWQAGWNLTFEQLVEPKMNSKIEEQLATQHVLEVGNGTRLLERCFSSTVQAINAVNTAKVDHALNVSRVISEGVVEKLENLEEFDEEVDQLP